MAEPIIEMTDLRRSFVVRDKAGRVRRTRRVVHAVDGITATIEAGRVLRLHRCQRGRQVDHDQDADRHPGANVGAGTDLWSRPGPATAGPGSRARSRLWSAQPAVVGPAAAGLLPDPGRNSPARRRPRRSRGPTSWSTDSGSTELLNTPVRQLSLGERMRGEVAAALVHSPTVAGAGRADHRP